MSSFLNGQRKGKLNWENIWNFIPDENLFDENGRKIIRFFLEEYLTEQASGKTNYSYYASASQQVRSVSIFGSRIDSIYGYYCCKMAYICFQMKEKYIL